MTFYAPNVRFDTGRPMTEDQIREQAPSIFATQAHDSRSDRFKPIPTIQVLRGLAKEGFEVAGVKQSRTRDASKKEYTKHMIRLRRFDEANALQVGGTVCEMVLKNANDGTSAYDLMAGLFRIQCLNSLVAQTATLDSVKVRHTGDVQGKVIEGTYKVLEEAKSALEAPREWSALQMSNDHKIAFAEAAHMIRFGDAEGETKTPIKPETMIVPRRYEDRADDLWTTFNVAQENAIRGGMRGVGLDANMRRRRVTARQVNGIDQDIKINKALWIVAQAFASNLK